MTRQIAFSNQITEAEVAAGFRLEEIATPEAHSAGDPVTIEAVVFYFDEFDRVVKMNTPGRGIEYKRQIYGVFTHPRVACEPGWIPYGSPRYNPSEATSKSACKLDDLVSGSVKIAKAPRSSRE